MNPLDILSPEIRKYAYASFATIGVVIGALALTPASLPEWVPVVYAFLGGALGLQAYSKTDTLGNSVTVSPEGIAHVVTPETEQHFDLGTNG